jgi:hypothetical protein
MEEQLVLPQNHFTKRVKAQYSSVHEAFVREIIQNIVDAHATTVDFVVERDRYTDETTWSATDNGQGMNLQEFREYFLTLGGTKKDTNSIGGFGAAKEILAFAWENWWAKGQGFMCEGHGAANPSSKPDSSQPVGFAIGGSGMLIRSYDIRSAIQRVVGYSFGMKVKVTLNGELVKPMKPKSKLIETFEFGNMYVIGKTAGEGIGDTGYAVVTHGGLYSCKHYLGGMRMYHLNVNRNLGPSDVFTESRDSLLYSISSKVNMAADTIKTSAQEKHDEPTCRIFVLPQKSGASVSIGNQSTMSHIPFVGTYSGGVEISSEPAAQELKRDGFNITSEENLSGLPFQFAVLRMPGARKRTALNATDLSIPDKLAMTTIHITLNVIAKALGRSQPISGILYAKELGLHCKVQSGMTVIAINPKAVFAGPVDLVDTIIHEFAHEMTGSHGADFESVRGGYVTGLGLKYIKLLMEVVSLYNDLGIRVK